MVSDTPPKTNILDSFLFVIFHLFTVVNQHFSPPFGRICLEFSSKHRRVANPRFVFLHSLCSVGFDCPKCPTICLEVLRPEQFFFGVLSPPKFHILEPDCDNFQKETPFFMDTFSNRLEKNTIYSEQVSSRPTPPVAHPKLCFNKGISSKSLGHSGSVILPGESRV